MKCACCQKVIPYEAGVKLYSYVTREMVYGEFCIYPTETGKIVVCSLKCLASVISDEIRK